jgi:hypothetical protein
MVVLCYPERKWRSPEDGLDHNITIICIKCIRAREHGRQYTKRLLPGFLKPYRRVRLDLSLEFYSHNYTDSGGYNWEDVCTFLGCIDIRTAKRHISELQTNVPRMNLELTQLMSHKSGFFTAEETSPDIPPVNLLALRVRQVHQYHVLLFGNLPSIAPGFYTPAWVTHAWFCSRKLSTSYVLKNHKPHDTS